MIPFACNMNALDRDERQRHHELLDRLVAARAGQSEIEDGYLIALGPDLPLAVAAEWMALESRCCPFLFFALELQPGAPAMLRLSGPPGVKPFLDAELGMR